LEMCWRRCGWCVLVRLEQCAKRALRQGGLCCCAASVWWADGGGWDSFKRRWGRVMCL